MFFPLFITPILFDTPYSLFLPINVIEIFSGNFQVHYSECNFSTKNFETFSRIRLYFNISYRVKLCPLCFTSLYYTCILYTYKKVNRSNVVEIFPVNDLRGIWCIVNVSMYLVRYIVSNKKCSRSKVIESKLSGLKDTKCFVWSKFTIARSTSDKVTPCSFANVEKLHFESDSISRETVWPEGSDTIFKRKNEDRLRSGDRSKSN